MWDTLSHSDAERFFAVPAESISSEAGRRSILAAMSGVLYVPASRADLSADVLRLVEMGVTSVILDLEDGIHDGSLPAARDNVAKALQRLGTRWAGAAAPLALFLRVRTLEDVAARLGAGGAGVLAGLVIPKCDGEILQDFGSRLDSAGAGTLWLMPVVETADFVRATTRRDALAALQEAVLQQRDRVLAVRFGSVDLAGVFGARLEHVISIYDVPLLASALGDLTSVISAPGVSIPVAGSVHERYEDVDDVGPGLRLSLIHI